jgi:proline iminopeptidase
MRTNYPDIKPYAKHRLQVSELHELYVEESGSPTGHPVIFIHGGPGAGCDKVHRTFFDPDRYRIILFDQRGAGRSTPHAELKENNTQELIADLEAIRAALDVDKWMLFGGSWGSTLALLYAQAFPERVTGMILRGIFLAREQDYNWLYKQGAGLVYPDYWNDFIEHIPEHERGNLVEAYYKRLMGNDEVARLAAAKAWAMWEGRAATLHTNPKMVEHMSEAHVALSLARISAHYFVNRCFIEDNQIIDNIDKIQHIPGIIVHGRYDMVCTLDNAYTLQKLWPASELHIIRDAGHSAGEPGNVDALIKAADSMVTKLSA